MKVISFDFTSLTKIVIFNQLTNYVSYSQVLGSPLTRALQKVLAVP